ncbi:aminopeptidase [Alicyclobacillus sp. SO9]|nr:aminopeptidase [Alicyclobacillus sp. SO9]
MHNYAELIVKFGVNVQKGQDLVVSSSIETAELVREVVKQAYNVGAKHVHVYWNDEETRLIELLNAPEEALQDVQQWIPDSLAKLADEKAAFLFLNSTSPFLYEDVSAERMTLYRQSRAISNQEFQEKYMARQWCIIAAPSPKWAAVVFPDMPVDQAVDKLWERIFYAVRLEQENPVDAWKEHLQTLRDKVEFLNKKHYRRLHYTGPGTDLTVDLPKKHLWASADKVTEEGVYCCVNMPTEEVFTTPSKFGVSGKVRNTKPLNYGGNIIDGFTLTLKEGRIVDYSADQGEELLKGLIDTDEGAHYLGEIALVPHRSPISDLNVLFYNTLFDENASCHIAIGRGLPMCIEGGFDMTPEEMEANEANISMTHVDFMIGSAELSIDGELEDGTLEPLFRNGNWAH